MQRYFIDGTLEVGKIVTIIGESVHQLTKVMRSTIGDCIKLSSENNQSAFGEIIEILKHEIRVKVVEIIEEKVELPVNVTIAQGLIKGDKFDWVIQKATECGANFFIPVRMKRSVVKIEDKKTASKVQRWQKISFEAARQSHRQVVPKVSEVIDFSELIKIKDSFDLCLFAYENYEKNSVHSLATHIRNMKRDNKILVVIGPEGGIDDKEVKLLVDAGFDSIGLGPRILRTETAPIYFLSAISYELEIRSPDLRFN